MKTLDFSVGEAELVRSNLFKVIDFDLPKVQNSTLDYPNPNGLKSLVDLLEWKHNASVIITNGAKQGLAAVFYLLSTLNKTNILQKAPYWGLIPPLGKIYNCDVKVDVLDNQSIFALAPNNPDGWCPDFKDLKLMSDTAKELNVPFIHDAVYFNHSFLPKSYKLGSIGDVQLFSFSKSLGLSGLRVGYMVVHNKEYYNTLKNYIDATTVGVSNLSQEIVYTILNRFRGYPSIEDQFHNSNFEDLKSNKILMKSVNSEQLIVPNDYENNYGLFGWFKKGNKLDLEKSKINVLPGDFFGNSNFIRMNLAVSKDKIQNFISRLNDESNK